MARLEGKVAIITGGTGGLGQAAVELFVAEGARVVIADLDEERGEALVKRLGDRVVFRRADVSREEEVQGLIDTAVNHFGGLHIMFNNAAISCAFHLQLQDDDFADFQRVMNVNLLGVILGTQLAARHMMHNGGGSIINTSATSGIEAGYGVATYRITKAGVNHFSKSAAIDYGAHNIRVNCIAPGNISTEMNAFSSGDADTEQARQWAQTLEKIRMAPQPLKRHGTPRDVAEAALFLASDDSAFVTGTVLPVDGGITCGHGIQ
ncbi:SDR family NAD(P)-dependent oxidoreductase [Pseudomaricurvus sp. HS19]|uniref:SDR family NAD(P)-dependent oxidoreductase n=1 Tax=Pseudomaricurvus sp. HS19 TaxID=2692626 RepID=UPI0013708DD9|nr:SDR family oxidoreductase [Pseudomaricurvus sp. HS19]MYM62911.1 glucose 1-dehydrogenase [Pseudomaricurvus sp. HS19]